MGTKVVGKLDSWSDADLGGSDFLNLDEGSNPVRVITSPYQFYIHWSKDATGANRKIRCALNECPLCEQGERAQARWVLGVVSRKANKPAIIEIGPQIFKQLKLFADDKRWGDPRKYDVDVRRQPKGSQPLYVVTPYPKEALTDEEKGVIKEFLARTDFVKISASSTAEDVMEKMGITPTKPKASEVDNDFSDDVAPEAAEPSESDDFNFDV